MLNNITHQSTEINLFYFKNIKISISKKNYSDLYSEKEFRFWPI